MIKNLKQAYVSITSNTMPSAQALTVASGAITPALPSGLYAVLSLSGEGGVADDLTSIVLPATWIGRIIVFKMAGAGAITIKTGANLIIGASDFTLDDVSDRFLAEVTAANTIVGWGRSDNVHH
jgi:hypothetical protein